MFLLTGGFADREKAVIMRDGSCELCEPLSCNHKEADTRLILHASDAKQISERIVVWSPHTDVSVLGIQHYKNIKRESFGYALVSRTSQYLFHYTKLQSIWVQSTVTFYRFVIHFQVVTQQVHFLDLEN